MGGTGGDRVMARGGRGLGNLWKRGWARAALECTLPSSLSSVLFSSVPFFGGLGEKATGLPY